MEEFRAPIAESACFYLASKRCLTPDDFEERDTPLGRGCFLKAEARRVVIERFELKLSQRRRHPRFGIVGDYRRMIHLQVLHYIGWLQGHEEQYQPFLLR